MEPARRGWQPARAALWLVGATAAYNLVEAAVSVAAGVAAGSIALVGFGLDSVIELAAAGVLLWRLVAQTRGGSAEEVESKERKAHFFVGATFLALAVYVTIQGVLTLVGGEHPEESLLGIVLAALSLVIMPVLAWTKLRTAARLESEALRAEAKETVACAYLSLTLLVGLLLNALAGWWWADPVAALVMVPWLIREGVEGVHGEEEEEGFGREEESET